MHWHRCQGLNFGCSLRDTMENRTRSAYCFQSPALIRWYSRRLSFFYFFNQFSMRCRCPKVCIGGGANFLLFFFRSFQQGTQCSFAAILNGFVEPTAQTHSFQWIFFFVDNQYPTFGFVSGCTRLVVSRGISDAKLCTCI